MVEIAAAWQASQPSVVYFHVLRFSAVFSGEKMRTEGVSATCGIAKAFLLPKVQRSRNQDARTFSAPMSKCSTFGLVMANRYRVVYDILVSFFEYSQMREGVAGLFNRSLMVHGATDTGLRTCAMTRTRCATLLLLGFIRLLFPNSSMAQPTSAAGLIRFLTHQSDAQEMSALGIFTCGQAVADQAAAKSLAKLGDSALPDIEQVLDKIEKRGRQLGDGSPWLELAYAKITGHAGFVRLRRMENITSLGMQRNNLDSALALSLSLTSYVSDSRPSRRNIRCTRGPEPRDAVDQLILAWEKNDRQWLEASLGPRAKIALNSLLHGKTWAELRAEFWPTSFSGNVAVGYRFGITGPWSEPDETLDDPRAFMELALPEDPDLETFFKSRSGADCGQHRLKFFRTGVGVAPGYLNYLVDDSELSDLLHLIGSCAAKN